MPNLCESFYLSIKLYVSSSKYLCGLSALSGFESLSTAGKESGKMKEHLVWSSPVKKMKKDIKCTIKFCRTVFTEFTSFPLVAWCGPKMGSKAIQFSEIFFPWTEKSFTFNFKSSNELAYTSS